MRGKKEKGKTKAKQKQQQHRTRVTVVQKVPGLCGWGPFVKKPASNFQSRVGTLHSLAARHSLRIKTLGLATRKGRFGKPDNFTAGGQWLRPAATKHDERVGEHSKLAT